MEHPICDMLHDVEIVSTVSACLERPAFAAHMGSAVWQEVSNVSEHINQVMSEHENENDEVDPHGQPPMRNP